MALTVVDAIVTFEGAQVDLLRRVWHEAIARNDTRLADAAVSEDTAADLTNDRYYYAAMLGDLSDLADAVTYGGQSLVHLGVALRESIAAREAVRRPEGPPTADPADLVPLRSMLAAIEQAGVRL